jgi:DMSO/TMAO reductase YedYZ molybdopterin-dependent catalytic subunit
MNGEPLPTRHGAPVRLVVPGWYGMASVKWVARISVLESPFTGYFQTTRYVYAYEDSVVPVTRALVKSMIVSPCEGDVLNGRDILVKGLAWSGSGAITRVMVSEQASADWKEAALGSPASQYAWTPWECRLTVESSGRYVLRSRAEDASGNVQPESIRWNRLGYGNNATQPVIVQVTDP